MSTKRKHFLQCAALVLATALLSVSCDRHKSDDEPDSYRNVMILYSAGFNSLSRYLAQNIADLEKGYVPEKNARDVIVVVSRTTAGNTGYSEETAPSLFRIYKHKDAVVRDTLHSLPAGTRLTDPDAMRNFLTRIKDRFPAESYGMIFASHSTGWLPAGYYSSPETYDGKNVRKGVRRASEPGIALFPDGPEAGMLLTRSVGADYYRQSGSTKTFSHEMEITEMASAIPMHLDYLLFDSCLMGGAEVACAFKDAADKIGFSQAEVLSEGLNYRTLTQNLLQGSPDPAAVCRDYYEQYDAQPGVYHSATVSLVDGRRIDGLAAACKPLFEKYREEIRALDEKDVQGFGADKHWFFDLKDILEKAGAKEEELADFNAALGACVLYKATTGQYYSMFHGSNGGTVAVKAFCGLSMYLPSAGSAYLDDYYKTLSWNQATGLVE